MGNVVRLRADHWLGPPAWRAGEIMLDVIADHLRHLELRNRAAGTIYARRRALARMAGLLPVPLLDATAGDLQAWREGLQLGPDAVVAYVSHARQFYAWAIGAGLAGANPAAGLPVPRRPRRLPRPIADDRLFAAVASAPRQIRLMIVLAGWGGLRAKEIALLRREAVLDGAPRPVILIAADATKGSAERIVPLSAFVLEELHAYGLPASGWVFRRADGKPGPNRPATVSKLCNRHLHACGYPDTLHQGRHRFGTRVYGLRKDLRMVQELLGHLRPETAALYVAWDQADAAAAVGELPAPGHLRAVTG